MLLKNLNFVNHPILGNLNFDFVNEKGEIYKNILFVGENGCGKTSILEEIQNYNKSEYIANKSSENYTSVFLPQDLKTECIINTIKKVITGESLLYENFNLKNNIINNEQELITKVKELKNDRLNILLNYTISALLSDINSELGITGSGISKRTINTYSSGEQEIGLRLLYLKNKITRNTDAMLIDEIETAMHPRWQLQILNFLKSIICEISTGERDAQLFVATHSENILKSAINQPNTLVIRLYKEDNMIKYEKISTMNLVLDEATFPEVQYLVFGVPTIEYHICLYGKCQSLWEISNIKKTDNIIRNHKCNKANQIITKFKKNKYFTLSTYIRNKIDHPDNEYPPFTESQLQESIEILRNIIIYEKNNCK